MFVVKFNLNGSVAGMNACLVAKGYAQTYGVDYSDTFSPVPKLTSVRLFISLAASYDWDLHQLDIRLSTWRSLRRSLYGATSGVCCSGGDGEGVLSTEISVWFEIESLCLVWKIQSGN